MMNKVYQLDEASEIRGQAIVGATLILSEAKCRGLIDSTFSSGTLKLAQSKGRPMILRSTVEDSDVIAEKRQRDYPLFKARFVKCRFRGAFSGIDFGRSHDVERDGDFGAIETCDFTDVMLDGCRFFNSDISTLRLPAWPHVVLVGFAKRAQEVAATAWPGELGKYMRICADQPESVVASVIHVPSFAKLVACTEEQVREAFEKFGGLQT